MAEKKNVTVKPVAKAVAATKTAVKAAEVKPVEAKEEVKAAPIKKEEAKPAPVKKEEVKAETAKKTAAKKETVKKEAVKKTAEKTVAKKAPAKKEVKAEVVLEFKGNSYTEASLVQSAKDVWVYDLGKDLKDFKTVELYVKPEEQTVYYVVNKEVTGGFAL